jgi:hypothetical protein
LWLLLLVLLLLPLPVIFENIEENTACIPCLANSEKKKEQFKPQQDLLTFLPGFDCTKFVPV